MHTPTGRGPQAPDVGAKFKELQRNIEHVDRKLSGLKFPDGGFPLGTTVASAPFDHYYEPVNDFTRLSGASWTFALADGSAAKDAPVLTADGVDPRRFTVADAGWYVFRLWVVLRVSGTAPTYVEAELNLDPMAHEQIWYEPIFSSAGAPPLNAVGGQVDRSSSPVYMNAGDGCRPQIEWPGSATMTDTGYGVVVEVTRVG